MMSNHYSPFELFSCLQGLCLFLSSCERMRSLVYGGQAKLISIVGYWKTEGSAPK